MTTMWMIRAGRGGDQVDAFLEEGFGGVGFGEAEYGGLPPDPSRDAIVAVFRAAHPQWTEGKVTASAGQLARFLGEVKEGDAVVTGDPSTRRYYVGVVAGAPRWEKGMPLPCRRSVKWKAQVARDDLSVATLNTLGAIQTLFKVSAEANADLRKYEQPITESAPPPPKPPVVASAADVVPEDLLATPQKALGFIDDMINSLDWDELQDLVAGLLRAMGYKTRISPPGPDRGVDIRASPDPLGLEEPRIFVEVKHREAATSAPQIRSFIGGRKPGDRCLYVSTGGFKKDARYEADRSNVPVTLVALPELRELLLSYYEKLDEETRFLVPLRRVYLPFDPNA